MMEDASIERQLVVVPTRNTKSQKTKKSNMSVSDGSRGDGSRGDAWSTRGIASVLDIYKAKWQPKNQGNLKTKHWEQIAEEHAKECPFEPVRTLGAIKGKIEHLKATYNKEKVGPKEQTGREGSDWKWFQRLEVLLAKTAKGDGVFGRMDT